VTLTCARRFHSPKRPLRMSKHQTRAGILLYNAAVARLQRQVDRVGTGPRAIPAEYAVST